MSKTIDLDLPHEFWKDLKVQGVGRDGENEKAISVYFTRGLSNAELRTLHDFLRQFPVIATTEHASTLTAQAAALVAAERERDEALDRVEELEAEAGVVSDEFEKECWRAMKSLLKQCEFDWSWVDSDGISADDAREHISETINGIEGDRKAAVARAEAAESEVATLKARVAELEAGLEPFAKHLDEMKFDRDNNGNELPDDAPVGWVYLTNGDFRRARRLTHQEKNNGR